jgi:hypothetical protein
VGMCIIMYRLGVAIGQAAMEQTMVHNNPALAAMLADGDPRAAAVMHAAGFVLEIYGTTGTLELGQLVTRVLASIQEIARDQYDTLTRGADGA